MAVLGFGAWKLGFFDPEEARELEQATGREFLLPAFVGVYAAVTALALPGSPLAYGAGAVFGFPRAALVVWIASMIGAFSGYALARGVLAEPAKRLVDPRSEMLRDLRHSRSVLLTALRLQLLPFIPFGLLNYGAGIGKVPLAPFMLATAIGVVPGTVVETFVGDRLSVGIRGQDHKALLLGIGIPLLVFTASYAPRLWKKLRR